MSVKFRQMIEKRIARRTVSEFLKAGFYITVFDCEEFTLIDSTDPKAILSAMFTTDDDRLYVRKVPMKGATCEDPKGGFFGWVWFVYGNDGWDVISDYTVNLEPQMVEVETVAKKLEELFG